jgi:ADP-ribose pyrophosphatase YjhB (NUDIX family)
VALVYCSNCAVSLPAGPPVTCPRCGASHWANPKPCGGALVTDGGRVLLVRRANEPFRGRWDIPGGFCELHEHPARTAAREVREETGLEARIGDLIGMWIDDYGDTGDVTLNCYFHAELVGGDPAPQAGEVAEIGWFAPGELPAEMAFPSHEPAVLAAWRARFQGI